MISDWFLLATLLVNNSVIFCPHHTISPLMSFCFVFVLTFETALKEGWLPVVTLAQWQSAGSLNQRPCVRLPVVPLFFRALCHFKGLQTVTARLCLLIIHYHYRSSDHRGVLLIGLLSLLWLCLWSFIHELCTLWTSDPHDYMPNVGRLMHQYILHHKNVSMWQHKVLNILQILVVMGTQ